MNPVLALLIADDFIASVGVISSARGVRRHLYKSRFVGCVRSAIEGGIVSEDDIDAFVNDLMDEFSRGVRFPHELALAALSVILETRKTKFAEDFLLDLARLNITEMTFSPQVARESLRLWYSLPRYKSRVSKYALVNRLTRAAPASRRFWHQVISMPVKDGARAIRFREDPNAPA